jgi:hypothetical protein
MDDGDLKILHEGRLLTPGEFDAELHSRNLGNCIVVEKPFPRRALDSLSIYPEYLEVFGSKTNVICRGRVAARNNRKGKVFQSTGYGYQCRNEGKGK